MNRPQWLAILFAAANLALQLLFPPYDYVTLQRGNVPTFDGFYFLIGDHVNRVINRDFLLLEVVAVLVNLGIAWILLGKRPQGAHQSVNRLQRGVLWLVSINLTLMLLFPPFEYYYALSTSALPTFDGFYFVFGDNSQRQIVTSVLYIEIAVLLINAGLLWLLFEERRERSDTRAHPGDRRLSRRDRRP